MPTIFIPKEYSDLAERLAKKKAGSDGRPVFSTYMHLMLFAALVGRYTDKDWAAYEVKNKGPEVYDSIFANHNMDGVAFLLALQAQKDGEILREKKENECWKILEQYAANGFREIGNWLIEHPGDTTGVDTILNQMKVAAKQIVGEEPPETDLSEVSF